MRALAVFIGLVVVLGVGFGAAEFFARQTLDERADAALSAYLRQASDAGLGFAVVAADEQGWALPDLARGELSRIDAVAADGRLAGVEVERMVLSAGPVDLRSGTASQVRADVTLGTAAILALVEQGLAAVGGVDVAASAVQAVSADTLRVTVSSGGIEAVLDLRLRLDGVTIVAEATAATIAGQQIDPAAVVGAPVVLFSGGGLPEGLVVTAISVEAVAGTPGAAVTLVLGCPGLCSLTGG